MSAICLPTETRKCTEILREPPDPLLELSLLIFISINNPESSCKCANEFA